MLTDIKGEGTDVYGFVWRRCFEWVRVRPEMVVRRNTGFIRKWTHKSVKKRLSSESIFFPENSGFFIFLLFPSYQRPGSCSNISSGGRYL